MICWRVCTFSSLHPSFRHQSTASAASRVDALRRHAWLSLHPVEKWTALVDLGRHAPRLLDPATGALAPLPYCVRLRLCLSLLLWVRALRDVQDTLARLRLPFAPTRRVRAEAVADVFPTRWAERAVDPFTTVALATDARRNPTAEQSPAPSTWDPDAAEADAHTRRPERRRRHGALHGAARRRGADDHRVRRQEWAPRGASAVWEVNAAKREAMPSPLASDADGAADDRYHHDHARAEGCPVEERGELCSAPIHIAVPSPRVALTRRDPNAVVRYCVMAHAAVLSSLFVEGRTVRFTTNDPIVFAYVKFLFPEWIEDRWMSASLVTDEETAAGARDAGGTERRSYFPSWSLQGALVVMPPARDALTARELHDAADFILHSAPCSVLVESPGDAPEHYVTSLKNEVARRQAQVIGDTSTEAFWQVSWVPLTSQARKKNIYNSEKNEPTARGEAVLDFQVAVNEVLRQFHLSTFVYFPSNCALGPRAAQDWWWRGLPPSIHIVGVNSHALDLLYYYPHAPFLRKRVGGAFRYQAVRRVLMGKNVYGGADGRLQRWAQRCVGWRGLLSTGLHSQLAVKDKMRVLAGAVTASSDEAVDALRWERTLEYLANPSKWTWLSLMLGKLFRL